LQYKTHQVQRLTCVVRVAPRHYQALKRRNATAMGEALDKKNKKTWKIRKYTIHLRYNLADRKTSKRLVRIRNKHFVLIHV
jgi:hypothetical protein